MNSKKGESSYSYLLSCDDITTDKILINFQCLYIIVYACNPYNQLTTIK